MNLISPAELGYISGALLAGRRTDGRALFSFREISLATSCIPQASGSARVGCAGTDVLVGIKLETGSISAPLDERLQISIEVSESALQSLPSDPTNALLSHAYALTSGLVEHKQLVILPQSKSWHLQINTTVLSSDGGGNLYDILAVAIRSALWDMRIPNTRPIAYVKAKPAGRTAAGASTAEDEEMDVDRGMEALLKGRKGGAGKAKQAETAGSSADFELLDYEAGSGQHLTNRNDLPVSITMNLTPKSLQPFIDATLFESYVAPIRLVAVYDGQGNVIHVRQEIPEASASLENNDLPYDRLEGLIDMASNLSNSFIASLNERLKDPLTGSGGVRLAAFP